MQFVSPARWRIKVSACRHLTEYHTRARTGPCFWASSSVGTWNKAQAQEGYVKKYNQAAPGLKIYIKPNRFLIILDKIYVP